MLLKPLQQFICDGCGAVIQQPQHAEILWTMEAAPEDYPHDYWYYNYKLVHKRYKSPYGTIGCGLGDQLCNNDIETFLELFLLDPECKDISEFQELMHRLTIPYFEEAKLYMAAAIKDMDMLKELCGGFTNAKFFKKVIELYGG